MSRPMLPGQNSKYWGYDLNNYLLSLENKISGLESFHQNQQTIVQNVGPGFHTGEWELTTSQEIEGVATTLSIADYTLTGKCSYESYVSGSIRSYVREFNNEEIFKEIYVVEYDSDGKLSYPNGTASIGSLPKAFYAVYLFFERSEDGNSDTVRTLFCKDYIFRGDCIMIGSYEKAGGIFTPRVQSSSKTLYQSGQDTIHSYAAVECGCSNDRLPLADSKDSNNIYDFKKFYYYSNGVSPSEILSNIKDSEGKFTNRSYDVFSQINNGTWKTYLVSEAGGKVSVGEWSGSFGDGKLAAYYLAPSGNIYVQIHAGPTNYPTVKDYNMEAVDPLRDKEGFITGGLVFIGTVFKKQIDNKDVYDWVSSASNGISPILLDINRVNPHKILIENNEYWVGNTWYNIDIDEDTNNIFKIQKKKTDIPYLSLNNSVHLIKTDSENYNSLNELGLYLYKSNGYCISLQDKLSFCHNSSENYNFTLSMEGIFNQSTSTHKLKIQTWKEDAESADQNWIFYGNDGTFETSKLIVEGIKIQRNEDDLVQIGDVDNYNNFSLYGNLGISEGLTIGFLEGGDLTVYGKTILYEDAVLKNGFKTDESNTFYFNSKGNIKCNDITFISDIRLKTNLKPINSKICHNAVQNLNVNTYTYIRNNHDTLGLIAQEIEEQLPEYAHLLVHENEDGEKMVSEHKLLFILWEALKQEIKERKGGK